MSGQPRYNSLNPPPSGTLIPGSLNYETLQISSSKLKAGWPTSTYPNIITQNTTINFNKTPFTYIKAETNNNIVVTITQCPKGTTFILEIEGSGSVQFTVVKNNVDSISSGLYSVGTYVIVVFKETIKGNNLENPIAT